MHNPKSEIVGCDKLPHLTGISSRDSERLGKKNKDLHMEYLEISETLVKWDSILYKASLTFIFIAILCNS